MKMRILSLSLATLLLAAVIGGCAKPTETSSSGGTASQAESQTGSTKTDLEGNTYEVPESDGLPDTDLNGYEFRVAEACYYDGSLMPNLEETGVSEYYDAIIARNKAIEDRFNCKIVYDYYSPVTFYELMLPQLMSGTKTADIMTPIMAQYGKFVNTGYLYNMSNLPHIQLDKPWYIHAFSKVTQLKDGVYGCSAFMNNPYMPCVGVMFNKKLVEEFGLGDLYKMVEEDRWNWDTFRDLLGKASRDVNNDGIYTDDDIWSCALALTSATDALFLSSGQHIFDIDGAGYVQYTLQSSRSISVLNKMKEMFSIPGSNYMGGGDYAKCNDQFMNNKATFYINKVVDIAFWRNMEEDYGVLPLPKYPGQENYSGPVDWNTPIICIPTTIDNPEATGLILEAMAFASLSEQEIWEEEVNLMNYRDDESMEMIKKYILPNVTCDMYQLYANVDPVFGPGTSAAILNPIMDKNLDASAMIEANKDAIQAGIDSICNNK